MVKGLKSLNRRMAKIPKQVRAAAQEAIDKNADELTDYQRSLAPYEDGDLRNSIRHSPLPSGRVGRVVKAGGWLTTVQVKAGATYRIPFLTTLFGLRGGAVNFDYSLAQEFGTENMTANPFFYPAYRIKKRRLKSRVTRAINKAIKQGGR